MKRVGPLMLCAAFVVGAALPAQAGTTTIHAVNFQFSPRSAVTSMGDTVKWHDGDGAPHTVTSNTKLFDLYLNPGQSRATAFKFAGAFPYYCKFHGSPWAGMHGRIEVPALWLNTGTQHVGDVQQIRIASVDAPDGIWFNVQFKGP